MATNKKRIGAPRRVSLAKLDSAHVRERRAMRAAGITCNFSGKDSESEKWYIDYATAEVPALPVARTVWIPGRHGMSLEVTTA